MMNIKEIDKMKTTLDEYGVTYEEDISYDNLCKLYNNIKIRFFIRDKKCNVFITEEFIEQSKMLTKTQRMAISDIKYRLEENLSIKPYLSNYMYLNKFSKEDSMLIEHNIYHLHLNCTGKKERIVKRTNKLLYITYDVNNNNENNSNSNDNLINVYFLAIKKHFVGEEWNNNEVIELKNKYLN